MSTVVDVSLALLLVSASVVTLAAAPPPDVEDPDAGTAASLLASTTVDVDYPGGDASGTVAGLLADATAPDSPAAFDAAVRQRTRKTLANVSTPVQVFARPIGGQGEITVGHAPPRSATVAATTFVVPAGRTGTPVRIVVRTWSQ